VNQKVTAMVRSQRCAGLSPQELERRMVLLMVNEAARCLEEDLVAGPEDIDFGMIFGTGFAPFRGGPLRYADGVGIPSIVDEMNRLAEAGESRFVPCDRLQAMAKAEQTFYP
jgi:3-hydroxyacyl-CoA dehydrogenase/enoyl-CoA hydratase/3-hydroxybutyryl-CoA epimerase